MSATKSNPTKDIRHGQKLSLRLIVAYAVASRRLQNHRARQVLSETSKDDFLGKIVTSVAPLLGDHLGSSHVPKFCL